MFEPALQGVLAHDVLHLSGVPSVAQPEPLYLLVRAPADPARGQPQLLLRARYLPQPHPRTHPPDAPKRPGYIKWSLGATSDHTSNGSGSGGA